MEEHTICLALLAFGFPRAHAKLIKSTAVVLLVIFFFVIGWL
jgi:hypothetical protein